MLESNNLSDILTVSVLGVSTAVSTSYSTVSPSSSTESGETTPTDPALTTSLTSVFNSSATIPPTLSSTVSGETTATDSSLAISTSSSYTGNLPTSSSTESRETTTTGPSLTSATDLLTSVSSFIENYPITRILLSAGQLIAIFGAMIIIRVCMTVTRKYSNVINFDSYENDILRTVGREGDDPFKAVA